MQCMYPLKFNHIYFEKIWGGRELEQFRSDLPKGDVGESWDVACHNHGTSIILNGEYKGMTLEELISLKKEEIIGTEISEKWFPILVKIINSKDKLSIQVHPDDKYGKEVEGDMGKTEIWYVIEAFQGANLVVGTKNCVKEEFKEAIEKGELDKYLNKVEVKKGDVYFVKSGLVHAIGEGVIIAEIQQNSDITYRVYDYNRGRELHVEKALEVVDLSLKGEKSIGLIEKYDGYDKIIYCKCDHFTLELYDVKNLFHECSDKERFFIFTCVEGEGIIFYENGQELIKKGDSILIPATLGNYKVVGELKLIKSYQSKAHENCFCGGI